MAFKPAPIADGVGDAVRSKLPPGEILIALCHLSWQGTDTGGAILSHLLPPYRLFVLTNRSLRVIWYDSSGYKKGQLDDSWFKVLPLTKISQVTARSGNSRVGIAIEVHGGDGLQLFSRAEEAKDFARKLQDQISAAQGGEGTSIAEELSKLAALTEQGSLSDEEWMRAKELFLGRPPDVREGMLRTLRSLGDLHKSGVLSEGEFNMKKWDILSRRSL